MLIRVGRRYKGTRYNKSKPGHFKRPVRAIHYAGGCGRSRHAKADCTSVHEHVTCKVCLRKLK